MSLRITGGIWRSRLLRAPSSGVRPTQDRVRAALFSILGAEIAGANVLDLFAGTGALGLEAASRGARCVVWVERHRKTWQTMVANVAALAGGMPAVNLAAMSAKPPPALACLCLDVWRFLSDRVAGGLRFDFVFADPPYAEACATAKKLLPALAEGTILTRQAWVILEQSRRFPPIESAAWRLRTDRVYGETRLCLYRRNCS